MGGCWHTEGTADTGDCPGPGARGGSLVPAAGDEYGRSVHFALGDIPMSKPTHTRRSRLLIAGATAVLSLVLAGPAVASAGGPLIRESDAYTVRFFDDLIFEMCGIETWTTLTERWTYTEYADGSAVLHNVRTFVPDDVRIPIEKGAATSFNAADGSRVVVGRPTSLRYRDGRGTVVLDAGRGVIDQNGDLVQVNGKANSWFVDLADVYCP